MKLRSIVAGLIVIAALAGCGTGGDPTPTPPTIVESTPPGGTGGDTTPTPPTIVESTPPGGAVEATNTLDATPAASPDTAATADSGSGSGATTPVGDKTKVTTTEPVINFMPRQGRAGAYISLMGANFPVGKTVTIRIGVPDPVGEPVASAEVGSDGRWNASFMMPGTLPSGESITASEVRISVMDENNQVYTFEDFKLVPGEAPSPQP